MKEDNPYESRSITMFAILPAILLIIITIHPVMTLIDDINPNLKGLAYVVYILAIGFLSYIISKWIYNTWLKPTN